MHSKAKAQELQATRKAMKEHQMMARQIEKEEKKKVSSFVIQKIFFSVFYLKSQLLVNFLKK
jgi:hypothetical protein